MRKEQQQFRKPLDALERPSFDALMRAKMREEQEQEKGE
jgi:hypothetical protein